MKARLSSAVLSAVLAFTVILVLSIGLFAATAGNLSVSDYGAKGDGKADDTTAFQKAMDECAGRGGGIVSVPTGKYLIKTHLNIPGAVTLEGVWRAPATVQKYHKVDNDPSSGPELTGSVLLAVEGAGKEDGTPFIMLNTNSTLKGVTIFYPEQMKTNPPKAYPWTVASAGADNCSVIDVLLVNPYQAVDFGSRVSGRHFIRNLYAQPLRRGLYVDHCLDIGRLENIHFWPFWTAGDPDSPVGKYMIENGEAYIFGRSDWEYVTNCFAISYKAGMRFIRGKGTGPFEGGGNYLLTQSGGDACDIAVLVEEAQGHSGISFSNCQIFGDVIIKPTNNGMVRFTGCGLFGSQYGKNDTALAVIEGEGRVSFDNCHFYVIASAVKGNHIIHAKTGRLSVTDSVFLNFWDAPYNMTPIVLEPEVINAVITNNDFYGKTDIVNRSKGKTIIKDNIFESNPDPQPDEMPSRQD